MRLGDLTTITRLGAGAFGTVSLVKHDSSYYALKQMNKSQIVQMGLQVGPSPLRISAIPNSFCFSSFYPGAQPRNGVPL